MKKTSLIISSVFFLLVFTIFTGTAVTLAGKMPAYIKSVTEASADTPSPNAVSGQQDTSEPDPTAADEVPAINASEGVMAVAESPAVNMLERTSEKINSVKNRVEKSYLYHLFLQRPLAIVDSRVKYFAYGTIESGNVLQGKNGWLFFKEALPVTGAFNDEQIRNISEILQQENDKQVSMGRKLIIIIAPNKSSVYKEYLPDELQPSCEDSSMDELVEYVRNNTDVTIIWPKQELLDCSAERSVYYKYDTHWNSLGAWICEQQLLDALYGEREPYSQLRISVSDRYSSDLAAMVGLERILNDDIGYDIDYSAKRKHGESILYIGDSFRSAQEDFIKRDFNDALILHRDEYERNKIDEFNPDIVVLEWAERYFYLLENGIVL